MGKKIDWVREEQKSDYKFLKPYGGSTTWTRNGEKWTVTEHAFKVDDKTYIWRVDLVKNWNIALESMHMPSGKDNLDVENSESTWFDYSLRICSKLGFTSVDNDYLEKAFEAWGLTVEISMPYDVMNRQTVIVDVVQLNGHNETYEWTADPQRWVSKRLT